MWSRSTGQMRRPSLGFLSEWLLYICVVSPLFLQNLHSRPGIVGGGDGGEVTAPGGGAGGPEPPGGADPGKQR